MPKYKKIKKQQAKKITAQAIFAFLSIALVPVYTLIFGTKEDPFIHTLSGIGNAFDHKLSFIFWGSITGLLLVFYTLYVFAKIDYRDKRSRRFLYASHICLILTVLTPALKDAFPVWHFVHVVFSTLFALLFVASILLFLQYLSKSNQELSKKSLFLLIACVGFSVLSLFLMGLNGVVEILFFIGIAVFLFVLGIYLDKFVDKQLRIKARKKKKGKLKGIRLELTDEKILVLSDTHGNEAGIKKAIELAGKVDAVIHLGDYDRDTKCIKNQKVFSVKGNCDLGSTQKSKRIVTIGGKRILMVHGHKQRVKLGLLTLGLYAQEKGADIALFGHTHIPTQQYAGNVLLYNPGCLSSMRQTYGIMTIRDDGRVKIKTYHLVQ